jgi:hypothetical protein
LQEEADRLDVDEVWRARMEKVAKEDSGAGGIGLPATLTDAAEASMNWLCETALPYVFW